MRIQDFSTTPYSQAYRLAAWSYSTTTIETGEWRTLLTLLLWKRGRVSTITFEFYLTPASETQLTVEQALTYGVSGELPLRPLVNTLLALSTGWSMTSQSLKLPKNGIGTTSLKPSLVRAKMILEQAGLGQTGGSSKRSPKPASKAAGTTRRRRSQGDS